MKKLLAIIILSVFSHLAMSQDQYEITSDDYQNSEVEMADTFRKEGKIYVVVGVTLIILAGLFSYTVMTERKISRLERMVNQGTQSKS